MEAKRGIEVARLFESSAVHALQRQADVQRALCPDMAVATLSLCGGIALFAGSDSPLTYAVGLAVRDHSPTGS